MNKKSPFERTEKRVVSPWSFVFADLKRLPEHDGRCRERLPEELRGEFGNRPPVFVALAGGNGSAGGNAPERTLPSPVAQALLEPPDQHPRFHASRATILMRLVEDDELPVHTSSGVKKWAVVGTDKQVLQHRVVG